MWAYTAVAVGARQLACQAPWEFLTRHGNGDWGVLCATDKHANVDALVDGSRLFSAYRLKTGQKIWIITEADRSVTTILLPDEY